MFQYSRISDRIKHTHLTDSKIIYILEIFTVCYCKTCKKVFCWLTEKDIGNTKKLKWLTVVIQEAYNLCALWGGSRESHSGDNIHMYMNTIRWCDLLLLRKPSDWWVNRPFWKKIRPLYQQCNPVLIFCPHSEHQ